VSAPETEVPKALNGEKKLDHITVYPEDKTEMDRLFGRNVSYAKRQQAILDVVKRERLVDKVRRKILGAAEAVSEGVYLVDHGQTTEAPSSDEELTPPTPPAA